MIKATYHAAAPFLSSRIGTEVEAVVTGVEAFGLFVQGLAIPAEGLVPLDSLPDDTYRYDRPGPVPSRRHFSGINDDMKTRPLFHRLLTVPKDRSFFVFGLRGVGKSTWSRQALPDAHRIDLLDEGLYQAYLRDPGLFAGELRTLPRGATVVVDEIQRLPSLLNEVHRFIEERRLRFVLLGSSARKLKQAGTNLLAGRAVQRQLLPLLPAELGRDFDLNSVLLSGSLPLIWNAADRRDSLEAYVQLYLKQEIQAEALVRNLPGFARFLPVAGVFHGQVLSVAGLARDAGVARTTVEGYLGILADTHVAWLLPAFERKGASHQIWAI